MPGCLEFCLLGPLTVRRDGVAVPVPPGKQRALLAVLLLRAGQPVTAGQLAELLWAPAPPPPSSTATVRNYVKRLRQALGAAGQDRIVTRPGGYLILVADGELDIARMEHELTAARRASRAAEWQQAGRHAAAAMDLWRGEPLCDVDLPVLAEREVPRLTELRLQARELRIEADLKMARHAEVVADLRELATASPLREHLHALLMLALYRCGRRAEALEAYRQARDVLVQEIGGEPGPELQALHRQILHDDPALAPPPDAAPQAGEQAGPRGQDPPRQLPAAVRCFTGREAELATLNGLATTQAQVAPTALITAIAGTAGVGKTALAVHWAHRVAGRFPDGQLYVNLRGYDPGEPVAGDRCAGRVSAGARRAGARLPDEVARTERLYRSRLAGRRMLVLLDNARDGDQVRPLLPGDPACVAIVTSRDALAGLVATDGARPAGPGCAAASRRGRPAAVADRRAGRTTTPDAPPTLAGLCARLPLAFRIVAELAAARRRCRWPGWWPSWRRTGSTVWMPGRTAPTSGRSSRGHCGSCRRRGRGVRADRPASGRGPRRARGCRADGHHGRAGPPGARSGCTGPACCRPPVLAGTACTTCCAPTPASRPPHATSAAARAGADQAVRLLPGRGDRRYGYRVSR